nr:hypothetical protein [Tanacetum cinerariifolium]
KNVKKISISNASLILEDFNPPLYELPFHKEVPGSETLLSFSSKNEEKVFNPGILTYKGVHTSLLQKLSHRGPKAFKVIKIFESPMDIFPCSYREDIRILDVLCWKSPSSKKPRREGSNVAYKTSGHSTSQRIVLKAMGRVINKAVTIVELIKVITS